MIVGEWAVDPVASQISRGGETVRVDARLMRVLMSLAARAGEVVTTEELLAEAWSGVVVTQDSVYQAVAALRRVLGDDSKKPAYIATVPRRGYRMVARVETAAAGAHGAAGPAPVADAVSAPVAGAVSAPFARFAPTTSARRWRLGTLLAVGAVLCLAQAASVDPGATVPPQRSVAVLPFLDLTTESMDQEFFADGLTEELIDDLSRVPDLRVPSATAAFYFKNKQMTVANIARELGVAYIVDGSLRKSGSTVRVAARLVRADNGFVVWARTFDRESDDVLKVQGDVAIQVTQELQATLQTLAPHGQSVR
ncbi:MAG: winged helix-turn-helix domain-containing protein [Proteobacteria bacterium]|nr:winged helix-turn-helix domain-containing protein [Pseudomonadota bacterium]